MQYTLRRFNIKFLIGHSFLILAIVVSWIEQEQEEWILRLGVILRYCHFVSETEERQQ
mgnify:FL=1